MEIAGDGIYDDGVSDRGGLARLFRYRDCLLLLSSRALKVRYRRSALGFGWALMYPLLSMAVLTVVFSRVFPEIAHYEIYVIVGVLAWGFFSLSCVQAMDALVGGSAVLRKIYVPSAVFPLAAVGANLVNLVLSVALLPVLMVAVGAVVGLHPRMLPAILLALIALAAFTLGLALALSALNLFFSDVRYFFEAILLIWFYASPIVYPASVIPDRLRAFLWLNPFYWFLEVLRAPLYGGVAPSAATLAGALTLGLVTLAAGWTLFGRLERRFYLYL